MAKLLMISGDRSLAEGKRGAFYNTLEEFRKYWDRIDVICPKVQPSSRAQAEGSPKSNLRPELRPREVQSRQPFSNVFIHPSSWPLIFQHFWIWKKGGQLFKENKFDLITVHDYPPFYNGIGARLLWSKIKVPYILEIFHIPGYPKASGIKEYFYKILALLFLRYDAKKAKNIRIINQSQARPFLLKADIPASKIIYAPAFYIDLTVFYPKEVKKEYDLIFIGRLVKNKGVDLLIKAVINTKHQTPNIKCLIMGAGSLKEKLKIKIKNLKLQDNVLLYGWAKDSNEVAELINKSRILVMPSYNEGGPRVVLEAIACGVPVIATSVGIVPDVIKDGESGDIIDWKAEDISQKIIRLLNDKERYERYSRNGFEIVKRFEKTETVRNYADKLKEIIKP